AGTPQAPDQGRPQEPAAPNTRDLARMPAAGAGTPAAPGQGAAMTTGRMLAQVPLRESFRDAKFRIQQRVIGDIDPQLDLANGVEVRREIEEAFGRALDAEGLALTRAERTRMLE